MKIKLYAFICAVLLCFATAGIGAANHFIVVSGGCGPVLFDDACSSDNTADWGLDGVTLAFDTDHYTMDFAVGAVHLFYVLKDTVVGQRYRIYSDYKDGTATGKLWRIAETTQTGGLYGGTTTSQDFANSNGTWNSVYFDFTAKESKTYIFFLSNLAAGNLQVRNLKCECI